VEAIFNVGADDACGELRAQGERMVALIAEGIHLFFDDVRRAADAAREKPGGFEDGRFDALVAETASGRRGAADDVFPIGLFGGQQVLRACGTAKLVHVVLPRFGDQPTPAPDERPESEGSHRVKSDFCSSASTPGTMGHEQDLPLCHDRQADPNSNGPARPLSSAGARVHKNR